MWALISGSPPSNSRRKIAFAVARHRHTPCVIGTDRWKTVSPWRMKIARAWPKKQKTSSPIMGSVRHRLWCLCPVSLPSAKPPDQACWSRSVAPRWINATDDEWIRNLVATRGIPHARLVTTLDLMGAVLPDADRLNWERHQSGLTLPDANDRRGLAAARVHDPDTNLAYRSWVVSLFVGFAGLHCVRSRSHFRPARCGGAPPRFGHGAWVRRHRGRAGERPSLPRSNSRRPRVG